VNIALGSRWPKHATITLEGYATVCIKITLSLLGELLAVIGTAIGMKVVSLDVVAIVPPCCQLVASLHGEHTRNQFGELWVVLALRLASSS